ncbi:hypothetical protein SDC9_181011 [bioreactor metagenome]|uniref:Lipoprotein SmpA/OmlA domain-containing protein n=1 Tax=bioreactor metagenome TaxID=1076179 RepID=A0A645HCK3_9ZZZZ
MMKSVLRRWLPPVGILLVLTGCAYKVNVSEVLQQPLGSKVHTRYHLWYTDPEHVSALNIMTGKFLPAGTEIEPLELKRGTYDIFGAVSVVDGSIRFKTTDGSEFNIEYDERLNMMPIEEFVRQLFTTEGAEAVYAKVPEDEMPQVKEGKLVPGMHVSSVLVVLGPPAKSRTTLLTNQSWLYWKSRDVVFRIIFKGDKIRQIVSLDQLEM